jgi:hypothetical protein
MRENGRGIRDKKPLIGYHRSGERSAGKAETKASQTDRAIKYILLKKLSAQGNAEYLGLQGIK